MICTENMEEKERRRFDLLLVEAAEQTERRELAPLLQMMGGVRRPRG